ncbi:hypothetical protein MUP77_11030 [Candidatus Bathyarchaeota archaeon]|nr:hypothetical protein [Candidatus Bathyarchaeota archaeon]
MRKIIERHLNSFYVREYKNIIGGRDDLAEKNRPHKKKEMTITMKSEPLKPYQASSTRPNSDSKRKQRDFKKKGPRGTAWIG